jgi:hypothetical protein
MAFGFRDGARIGVTRRLRTTALAAALTVGAAWVARPQAWATPGAGEAGAQVSGASMLAQRPFAHAVHARLPCSGCHGTGAEHRVTLVRVPRDCASCHHDPVRALACTTCHDATALPSRLPVSLDIPVPSAPPRGRSVTFRHDVHLKPGVGLGCSECHGTAVTLARNRDCASCHASHHGERVECASCHGTPVPGTHRASAHLGCAGSGCHAASRAPSPVASRSVCLFCHAERSDHEPGMSCAPCHRIPGSRDGPDAGSSRGALRP